MQYQAKSPRAPRVSMSGCTLMLLSKNSGVAEVVDWLWILKSEEHKQKIIESFY